MSVGDDGFLTPAELSARWKKSPTTGTLSNWRRAKRGPTYTKVGGQVRYPLAAVIEYENSRTHAGEGNDHA